MKRRFVCHVCGYESVKWLGKCPECGSWDGLTEEVSYSPNSNATLSRPSFPTRSQKAEPMSKVRPLDDVRYSTGIGELDRLLGGGMVLGSVLLIGGEPGVGKSTLLLQVANHLAKSPRPVLYVSGEESSEQLRLRAERLGCISDNLFIYTETDIRRIEGEIASLNPSTVIVDSIQTTYLPELPGAPGGISQIKACAQVLLAIAKSSNVVVVLVGHVGKSGLLAGPKLLEHIVDVVLYFEGEKRTNFRLLRSAKNRFGSTNELAMFEMTESGLIEVKDPSSMFLSERLPMASGSTVVACLEGSRPLIVEVQALVARTGSPVPRRMTTGLQYSRLTLILAILEKRLHIPLQGCDAYAKVAGGVYIDEPAVDLGLALAVTSSFEDKPIEPDLIAIGEVGLAGEIRSVYGIEARLREAQRMGFTKVLLPQRNKRNMNKEFHRMAAELLFVSSLKEAVELSIR